jgi:hypothetical protein
MSFFAVGSATPWGRVLIGASWCEVQVGQSKIAVLFGNFGKENVRTQVRWVVEDPRPNLN